MAETENTSVETRLASLEKSVAEAVANIKSAGELLAEIHTLTKRAAPLLDSPMAKLAQSPAAGFLGTLRGARRG